MKIGTLHRWSLTAATALPVFGVMDGSELLAISGALLVVLMLASSGKLFAQPRPKWLTISVHAITLLVLVLAIFLFPKARIDAVLLVIMVGIFNRWLLRTGHRDDLIILGAAAVLLAAATTITPGIAFAGIIVGYIICALWAALAAMVLAIAEREVSPEARRASHRRLFERSVGRLMGPIAVLSILFTLIGSSVMVFFPRYQFGQLFAAGYFMRFTGPTDEMELHTGGMAAPGAGFVAMRVEPTPGRGRGSVDGLYAKMGVLDEFDGRVWRTRVRDARRELFLYPAVQLYQGPKEAFAPDVDGPNTYRITMFRRAPREQPHPVATLGRDRPGYVAMYAVRQQDNGAVIRGPQFPGTQLIYKVDPDRSYETLPVPDQQERYLQLPELDPRVVSLAEQLVAGQSSDRDKVRAILSHFGGRAFTYSLNALPGTSDDPLVRFLFEAKQGHCELYAGATAVLLRLAGVKARVATGYYGGWWNDLGGYLELGQADGHAWVEAYYDGAWRWVDATPESVRARRTEKSFAWILDAYDALEALWHNNVLSFDERRRLELVGELTAELESMAGTDWFEGGESSKRSASATNAGQVALAAMLVVALAALPIFWWRRRSRRPEILGLRLRRALGGGTDATLGKLLAAVQPERRPPAEAAVRTYERFRFGPPSDAPHPTEVLAAIRAVERTAR